jgi:hypothetical protein
MVRINKEVTCTSSGSENSVARVFTGRPTRDITNVAVSNQDLDLSFANRLEKNIQNIDVPISLFNLEFNQMRLSREVESSQVSDSNVVVRDTDGFVTIKVKGTC